MKLIEIFAEAGSVDTIASVAETHDAVDFHPGIADESERQAMHILVADNQLQAVLDTLQTLLGAQPNARILVLPVTTVLPQPPEEQRKEEDRAVAVRESLYKDVEKSARFDTNYIALVALSTMVAVLGLIENNIAVVIGAMVIAPLLGPNLALALGTALGDTQLMKKSFASIAGGIGLVLLLSMVVGYLSPVALNSEELLARTNVGLDSVGLALAAGAAATLSLTTGLSSVLVGVMVAVALLPPAATLGLMLGSSQLSLATGAGLLLAVNVVCVNLSSKLVFLIKGIKPRTWWEKEKAKRANAIYISVWVLTLAFLMLVIFLRSGPLIQS